MGLEDSRPRDLRPDIPARRRPRRRGGPRRRRPVRRRGARRRPPLPHDPTTVVLTLENRSYGQIIGNPAAPYLNALARRYALATRYHALQHPSLPNYLALTTGSTQGVHLDCPRCQVGRTSLFHQLDRAGVAWGAFYQSLPPHWLDAEQVGTYRAGMNPFAHLADIRRSRADQARVSDFTALAGDLAAGTLPRFTWVTPDTRHDGHRGSIASLDAFAATLVPQLIRAAGPRGVVYVVWDEGARTDTAGTRGRPGGGHVALIAAGALARRHARDRTPATPYALLRTIEATYRLPPLAHAGRATPVLRGLLAGG